MTKVLLTWKTNASQGQCSIECVSDGPWNALLGDDPHPVHGSIDQLNDQLPSERVESITLKGHPSSCVLPILWVRTIWASTEQARISIEWTSFQDTTQPATTTQLASHLGCLLADEVRCDHANQVIDRYGFDPRSPGISEDAFDLLSGIVDLWDPALRSAVLGDDWTSDMKRVLNQCALAGHKRVGIYGAGTYTRAIGEAFMSPPVEICCIIDDDTRRAGERMWGFEIVPPETAIEMKPDAVVLSANSIEALLWDRASKFRDAGIETVRIYGQAPASGALSHA